MYLHIDMEKVKNKKVSIGMRNASAKWTPMSEPLPTLVGYLLFFYFVLVASLNVERTLFHYVISCELVAKPYLSILQQLIEHLGQFLRDVFYDPSPFFVKFGTLPLLLCLAVRQLLPSLVL